LPPWERHRCAVLRLRLRRRLRAPGPRLHRLPRSHVECRGPGGRHRDDGADEPLPGWSVSMAA